MKYINAELLREEIEKIYKSEIQSWLSGVSLKSVIYEYVLPLIDSLQQEQPEVDLETFDKSVTKMWGRCAAEPNDTIACLHIDSFIDVARHFFNLGCTRTAEKYDEIEHNRQREEGRVLPGFEDEPKGIPGKDFVPVEWVETLEMYGKWKIVKLEEAVEGEVMLNPYPTICLDDCKDYDFKDGDEVRIIIV